jgi:hypothetical protein
VDDWENRYHTRHIPTEATRWNGFNRNRWSNPEKDKALEDLFTFSVTEPSRVYDTVVTFSRLFAQDLPLMPIRYNVEPTTIRRGLTGVLPKYGSPGENSSTYNIHLWEWTE